MAVFVMFFVLIATVFFSFTSVKIIGDITGKAIYSPSEQGIHTSEIYIIITMFVASVLVIIAYYIRKGMILGAAKEMNDLNRKWWPAELKPPYGN